jgi:SAM-dependent methyltransferase
VRGTRPAGKERRAFTPARTPGRIERGGDAAWAEILAQAITAPQRDHEERGIVDSLTHGLHTYPARLHPATARHLTDALLQARAAAAPARAAATGPSSGLASDRASILDPFCGAGTVLVEARRAGARAVGVDANPLAVLVARAKTWTAPMGRRAALRRVGRELAPAAWNEGKAARRADYEPTPLRAPAGLDPVARSQSLEGWFAPHVRRELEYLATRIDDVRAVDGDAELADILTAVLSSILYKVSRRASDTDPSRVERSVGRGAAARIFGQRIELLCNGLDALARSSDAPMPAVRHGDARHLDRAGIEPASVDFVITSPPYAGTYDYAEQHQLRLDFLAMPASRFREAEIGSREQFAGDPEQRRRARRRYKRALGVTLAEIARVLAPGGLAAVILGDSVAGDRVIRADEVIQEAAGEHFTVLAWAWQERAKLASLEHQAFGDEPKREHVFLLARRAGEGATTPATAPLTAPAPTPAARPGSSRPRVAPPDRRARPRPPGPA